MKHLFFAFLTILSLQSFAQDNTVFNDANAEKRTLTGSFTSIKVSDGVDLYLTQSAEESVAVSAADPKYMTEFKTEVEDGVLKIYYDKKGIGWNTNQKKKLTAYVSFKTLQSLTASSGADVKMKSVLNAASLKLSFTSGSIFNGEVKTDSLDVSQNSGSGITINGKTGKLSVDVSSGAMFKGYELEAEFCEAKASSGAGIRTNVTKELNAKASSGGGIHYKGDGVVKDLNVSSGGSVKKDKA